MTCMWNALLTILPEWMRSDVDKQGRESLLELRLRINLPPELVLFSKSSWLHRSITQEDLNYVVNTASRYSPWTASTSSEGYLTAKGGHRIGLCGETVMQHGLVAGIHNLTSLCIRIARDFPGIAAGVDHRAGSILILGPPGWGKTTLLRDLIRQIGKTETVCVADERGEIFPDGLSRGKRIDVLTGCPKNISISLLLRTMSPAWIAVDEITDTGDCEALIRAAHCGVRLLASAHAESVKDLQRRSAYRKLLENHIFEVILILKKDRSFTMERMEE